MVPAELAARLGSGPLLLDGGLGSLLIAWGLPQGQAPERWVLERPEAILRAHRSYVAAGSDVLHCTSFGGSPPKLALAGLAGKCREVNVTAVALALEATSGSRTLVAGDVGPTGLLLPPVGTATESELRRAFQEQVEELAGAGAELLSLETMYDLREARVALAAALTTGLPVLVSLTVAARPRGFFTMMGDPLVASLQRLGDEGAAAVGTNCTLEGRGMLPVAQACRGLGFPLVLQPNAGQPRPTPEGLVYDASPREFARELASLLDAGVAIVGGCCGTDDRFIAAARTMIDDRGHA